MRDPLRGIKKLELDVNDQLNLGRLIMWTVNLIQIYKFSNCFRNENDSGNNDAIYGNLTLAIVFLPFISAFFMNILSKYSKILKEEKKKMIMFETDEVK